ncbi:hypothetical protein C2857_000646 [Epichloe festucae Fl1]|uniref:5'-3' DNA helicase ZGRF1-like N-terminal domain-containing protein n=1 Tax=Epichloe festucae (strain Fl1) TaxID=877507 RepID=A0A7S9KJS5_EPIFF|nr:hypothetical protein C2857_000646 [Epichloe festucae Fl1]
MSYAVKRIDTSVTPGSSGEAPPTTATVLDYNCLFTHDLKRKQKRWQDGKLKYHTFNKKIMVYDDRGNFIGDAHWQAGGDLEEDEELELDRGAAIVQVADCVGCREQDLTEVLDKRAREVEKRRAMAAAKTPAPSRARAPPVPAAQDGTHFQLSHRSLSSIVPSPGPLGRAAVSSRSPYETRKADGLRAQERAPPPAKKRRTCPSPPSKAGFARSLFGAALSLSTYAGGASSSRTRALKERRVSVQEVAGGETNDAGDDDDGNDDAVVVKAGERAKSPSQKSRHFENTEFTGPEKNLQGETASAAVVTPSRKSQGICGQSSSGLRRDDGDSSPLQPESRPALVRDRCRSAGVMVNELVEACHMSKSRVDRTSANKTCVRGLAEAKWPPSTKHTLPAKQQTPVFDDGSESVTIPTSPRALLNAKQEQQKAKAKKTVLLELPDSAPPKPKERRTELRIRSRQRRGLLMVSERRQGQQPPHPSTIPTPSEQSTNVELAAAAQEPSPDRNDDTCAEDNTDKVTSEAALEPTSTPQVKRGKTCLGDDSIRSPPDQQEAISIDSDSELNASVPGFNRLQPPKEGINNLSEPEEVVGDSRRRKRSTESVPAENSSTPQKPFDSYVIDDVENHFLDSGDIPTESSGKEKAEELVSKEEKPSTVKDVVGNSAPFKHVGAERSDQPGSDGNGTLRLRQRSEASVAKDLTEGEFEDLAPKRKTRTRRRIESPSSPAKLSSEEESACPPPNRRLSNKTKKASQADRAANSSEEESDCAPRKKSKRKQSKKECEVTNTDPIAELTGPRIKRLARKSVKSKEIFGFAPFLGIDAMMPAPFAMSASRIGTVGRPPTAPDRPPGISLTMKPRLRRRDGSAADEKSVDEVERPISGGQRGDEMAAELAPHELHRATTARLSPREQRTDSLPTPIEVVQNDGLAPRAKIVNPATRGRKAARKADAAGQVPRHIVSFEPPQPVRLLPKPKPTEPTRRDANLPGFSTASGGAWSRHAEDLLGMMRPKGERV